LSAESILRLTAQTLADLNIPYMVTGSLASAFYGEPRSTQDLDIVLRAEEAELQELGEKLRDAGLYCAAEAISEAAELSGMFNALDPTTGWKVDFIVLKDRAFNRAAFEARSVEELSGVPLHLIRAEDIVIAKLEWARLGGSERQLRDVVGVLMVQGAGLDRRHIERWVHELGVEDEWSHVLDLERAEKEFGGGGRT
jgi:hypothetical protein